MILPVRKAVIPAAGFGTRLLPVSKVIPKELLPLLDKPVLHYIVEEAIASGITEIQIVISESKQVIRDYFADSESLAVLLKNRPEYHWVEALRELNGKAKISFVCQPEQKGLGDAVIQSEEFVGDQPFAVLLGDAVMVSKIPVLAQLLRVYEQHGKMVIGTEQVAEDLTSRYGVLEGVSLDEKTIRINRAIEKPKPGETLSRQVIAGRYVFTSEVISILKQSLPGHGGEVQLTDAINFIAQNGEGYAFEFSGTRHDIGNPLGYLRASLAMGLHRKEYRDEILNMIEDVRKEFSRDTFVNRVQLRLEYIM